MSDEGSLGEPDLFEMQSIDIQLQKPGQALRQAFVLGSNSQHPISSGLAVQAMPTFILDEFQDKWDEPNSEDWLDSML